MFVPLDSWFGCELRQLTRSNHLMFDFVFFLFLSSESRPQLHASSWSACFDHHRQVQGHTHTTVTSEWMHVTNWSSTGFTRCADSLVLFFSFALFLFCSFITHSFFLIMSIASVADFTCCPGWPAGSLCLLTQSMPSLYSFFYSSSSPFFLSFSVACDRSAFFFRFCFFNFQYIFKSFSV